MKTTNPKTLQVIWRSTCIRINLLLLSTRRDNRRAFSDSESDEDFSEPEESEDEEFTVKKSSKAKRKEKVSKKDKPKPSPAPRKEKKQSRSSLSKPQAAGKLASTLALILQDFFLFQY